MRERRRENSNSKTLILKDISMRHTVRDRASERETDRLIFLPRD